MRGGRVPQAFKGWRNSVWASRGLGHERLSRRLLAVPRVLPPVLRRGHMSVQMLVVSGLTRDPRGD